MDRDFQEYKGTLNVMFHQSDFDTDLLSFGCQEKKY